MSNPPLSLTPSQIVAAQSAQWKTILKGALTDLRVATPARVLAFNSNTTPTTADLTAPQTALVEITLREQTRTPIGPQWQVIPPIANVPIVIPRGGGYSMTLPIKPNDEGLLVFCDMCIDSWWQRGGIQDQFEIRRHDLTDCGFFPGMFSQPNVLANYSADSLQIRSDDGATIIDVAEAGVTITALATKIKASGGTPLALVNDTWFQWFVTNIMPFLTGLGYVGPAVPAGSETTILKGQ